MENGIHGYPLLSEKTLLELGMVKYSADGEFANGKEKKIIKTECGSGGYVQDEEKDVRTMEKILSAHKKLFEGIGRFKDPHSGEPILTHIHMKPEAEPVIQSPRVIPHHLKEETKTKLDYFVKKGIMSWTKPGEPIVYASPLVITPKSSSPDTDVRIIADFRLANKGAPRTRIVPGVKTEDLSITFAGCKIFSKIDMNNGYHQFAIDEESKKYLVVTTPWGNLKHNTLAQGWITSRDEFDRRVSEILTGIPRVKNNRDDCLIGGLDWKDHNKNLNAVLSRLQSYGLTVNKAKCEFGKREIEFYGHRFIEDGLKPSLEKVKALKECGEPTTKDSVRSFLQMVGYMSRFIPNFSQIASPLRALTKGTSHFHWGQKEQEAFTQLKNGLTEETSLAYFVPNQPIRVHVDAGKKMEGTSSVPGGLCAILTQQDETGAWRMCHVANRTLTDVETRYGQTELEAVAIKWACSDAFHQYLVGAPKFEIITDCRPLEHLFNDPKSRAPIRIERQILAIQGLDYIVVYNKGRHNIADYGSRHITKEKPTDEIPNDSFEEEITTILFDPDSEGDRIIAKRASEDKSYKKLRNVVENNLWKIYRNDPEISRFHGVASDLSVVKGLVFYRDLLVPPFVMQSVFVDEAHQIGHSGEKRTVDLLREHIWFPGMTKIAKDVVKRCLSCQMTYDRTYDEPLRPTPLPPEVWHTISIAFKGPLKDGTYVFVVYDLYSRYPIVGYCKSTSFSNVKPILDSVIATFGKVHTIKTDNGPPFQGHQFKEYVKKKGFNHHRITPKHPRANGECERSMRNLNKAIRIADQEKADYKEKIAGMLEAYRATPHPSTSKSPYELMFGRKMNLNIFPSVKRRVRGEEVRNHDCQYKEKSKKYHDKKRNARRSHVKLGDRVLMKDMRTDRLKSEVGVVVAETGHSVTVKFGDGRIFKRDKSHIKIVNEAVTPPNKKLQERLGDTDESEEEDSDQEILIRTRSGQEVRRPDRFGEWTE